MNGRLLIIGAGGHGRVVADAALCAGWRDVAFLDDDPLQKESGGLPVLGPVSTAVEYQDADFVIAIGNTEVRQRAQDALEKQGLRIATVIQPSAVISPNATIGVGSVVMAGAVIGGILFSGGKYTIPEISLQNLHPNGTPIWPYMFITVACGAVSGFHATQSPMIAKCIKTEREGRKIFYGAMISESVIALVWAAAGVSFYGTTQLLNNALANGASNVVYEISTGVLGVFGGVLAVAGVIVCPITSGDTAFRSARLILAETFKLNQKKISNRLLITIPMLVIGGLLTWFAIANDSGFQIVWRYFSWSNQTLAMIALWVATAYLLKKGKYRFGSLLTAFPATFMTGVTVTYILMAQEGFRLNQTISYTAGICAAVVLFAVYLIALIRHQKSHNK